MQAMDSTTPTTPSPARIAMRFLLGALNGSATGVLCDIAQHAPDSAITDWGMSLDFGRNWLWLMEWLGWTLGAGGLAGLLITVLVALFSCPNEIMSVRTRLT
jgi:hypothetical protein